MERIIDWYDIKAPSIFEVKNVGKTLVNRSQGLSAYILYGIGVGIIFMAVIILQRTPTTH